MQASDIGHFEYVLLLLVVLVAAIAMLARRLQIAYPIMMVIGGLALSLLPHVPRVSLDPDIVFLIILPPLLFSAAVHTSWPEFRRNLVSIVMLAFGLVGFTIYGVAAATCSLLPGFDWHLGLVLGAVVAATDAIAATATAKRLGLPRRITELLEAESLVNDGSGLVALRFTVAMVLTGVTPSIGAGVGTLFYLISMAVAIGLVVAVIVHWLEQRIVDPPIEITISLITPYIAYLIAERVHCSGVLATLACGIYLGHRRAGIYSLHARIEGTAVWKTLDFILNGIVFLVLGLQLPSILAGIQGESPTEVILAGALFSALVILLRMLWVFPGAWLSIRIQRLLLRRQTDAVSPRSVFLVGWAGMRGVLALAAALSLPIRLNNGAPFPQRNQIIFLTFCVIFATLVLQGLSMPMLIRRLGLAGASAGEQEESLARRQMIEAALQSLKQIRERNSNGEAVALSQLEDYYRRRLVLLEGGAADKREEAARNLERARSVAQELRDVERGVATTLRNENKIHDEVLRTLERELDLADARQANSEFD
jgi:CPA1 family monovalent cation:H+ antiporter